MPARETPTKVLQNSRVSAGGREQVAFTMRHSAPMNLAGGVLKRGRAWDEMGEEIQPPKPNFPRSQALTQQTYSDHSVI